MKKVILITILSVTLTVAAGFYYQITKAKNEIAQTTSPQNIGAKVDQDTANNKAETNEPASELIVSKKETAAVKAPVDQEVNSKLISPLNVNIDERIWLNPYGNIPSETVKQGDYSDYICKSGKSMAGYHTGADFEVTKEEINADVPVYSISDGKVRQAGFVNGYGGLLIAEYNITGQTYTVYYGHIDLTKVNVKNGSTLKKGQKIAELAPACSSKNGNTRKHLHFGVHKGSAIDVKGYATDKAQLSNWIDPKTLF